MSDDMDMNVGILNGEMTKNEIIKYFNSIDIYTLGPII